MDEVNQLSILRVEGLRKQYRLKLAVSDVSFAMQQGQIVGLLGPNGAGKTTTFYMIAGFIKTTDGKVWLDNKDITLKPMYYRARLGINYLPQEPSVFRKLTVSQNVQAAIETRRDLNKADKKILLESLLVDLGIADLAKRHADTLSGGERRRTEVCRALAVNPSFLLLDEPFSGIDPIAVSDLRSIIAHLSEKNIGVLITDHNVRDTLSITQHAYIINHGEILTGGTADDLINDSRAREIYLGKDFTL
ncbi:MAG: LPS export ABC transporter ATP-binding protein [Spirochaeta sp. LUC14_002_19_P3]|nr:MAG: LPS export ABC transporter ATP-binding protein [Spirochaeta sp. LUC14_002_19_P3]